MGCSRVFLCVCGFFGLLARTARIDPGASEPILYHRCLPVCWHALCFPDLLLGISILRYPSPFPSLLTPSVFILFKILLLLSFFIRFRFYPCSALQLVSFLITFSFDPFFLTLPFPSFFLTLPFLSFFIPFRFHPFFNPSVFILFPPSASLPSLDSFHLFPFLSIFTPFFSLLPFLSIFTPLFLSTFLSIHFYPFHPLPFPSLFTPFRSALALESFHVGKGNLTGLWSL